MKRWKRGRREGIRKKKKKERARGRRMVVVVAVVGRTKRNYYRFFWGGDTSQNGLARRSQKGQAGLTTLGTGDHVPDSGASGCVDIYTEYFVVECIYIITIECQLDLQFDGSRFNPVDAVTAVRPRPENLSLSRLFHMHAIADTGQF